jgi:hypothetical protein
MNSLAEKGSILRRKQKPKHAFRTSKGQQLFLAVPTLVDQRMTFLLRTNTVVMVIWRVQQGILSDVLESLLVMTLKISPICLVKGQVDCKASFWKFKLPISIVRLILIRIDTKVPSEATLTVRSSGTDR